MTRTRYSVLITFTTCSEWQKVVSVPSVCGSFYVSNISGTAERICAKFTSKTCFVPRSDEFEGYGQRS